MSNLTTLVKDHPLKNTPIGQLIEEGMSNTEFSKTIGCASNTVSSWRGGKYASGTMQKKAAEYIADRELTQNGHVKSNNLPTESHDVLIAVPVNKLEKFKKLMVFGGFEYIVGD